MNLYIYRNDVTNQVIYMTDGWATFRVQDYEKVVNNLKDVARYVRSKCYFCFQQV